LISIADVIIECPQNDWFIVHEDVPYDYNQYFPSQWHGHYGEQLLW